jgi:hypothetical protein
MDSKPRSLVAVHQEFRCPPAWTELSVYQEFGVAAVSPRWRR